MEENRRIPLVRENYIRSGDVLSVGSFQTRVITQSPSKGPKFSREGVRRGTVLGNLRYYSEEKQYVIAISVLNFDAYRFPRYSAEHIAACRAKAEKIGRVEVGAAILVGHIIS